jgi:hypothetical protein
MKIKNINLKTIEARRYTNIDERPKQIRIDHNSSFTHISYIKDNQTSVDFQYTASYGSVGVIKIEGQLIYENIDAKDISKEWNDKRKVPDEIASRLHTAIMHACVPEAVGIAKDLALPPPIPLPQVRLGNKPTKAQSGPEVA